MKIRFSRSAGLIAALALAGTVLSASGEAQMRAPKDPDTVPLSPIYVSFRINPDRPDGGPASGFATESGSRQTHNVIATLPSDAGYSPLWLVDVYDNADFATVSDLRSAQRAKLLATAVAFVNCPVAWIGRTSS
jgi:hypothetical protein